MPIPFLTVAAYAGFALNPRGVSGLSRSSTLGEAEKAADLQARLARLEGDSAEPQPPGLEGGLMSEHGTSLAPPPPVFRPPVPGAPMRPGVPPPGIRPPPGPPPG